MTDTEAATTNQAVQTTKHPLAYIRRVGAKDLPPQVDVPEGIEFVYAVHGENGEPLALVGDRRVAFAVARQNDYEPVSVH